MIRRAAREDIPRILELLVQVDMVHHRGRPDIFNGPATKYSAEELQSVLADDKTPVFVCERYGTVAGHAFCVLEETAGSAVLRELKSLYIDDICVDEAFRRQGVGKELYRHVLEYAKTLGCYHVTLNVWCCNPGALEFYESLGMKSLKIGMEQIL